MKSVVLDTMKYNLLIVLFLLGCLSLSWAQEKRESEFRIKKEDFPKNALALLEFHLKDGKRTRFFKEQDGDKNSYEVKFKKQRLHYSIEFNNSGSLEDVEFIIKTNDIPEASWSAVQSYINQNYKKPRVKKIQQQYPNSEGNEKNVLKEAFQNLLLPYINYELIISCRERKEFLEYEVLFDAQGNFLESRKSIPSKYDHILY